MLVIFERTASVSTLAESPNTSRKISTFDSTPAQPVRKQPADAEGRGVGA